MWGKLTKPAPLLTKAYLDEHYVRLKKSANAIAREMGVAPGLIVRMLKEYEIPLRSRRESIQLGLIHSREKDT